MSTGLHLPCTNDDGECICVEVIITSGEVCDLPLACGDCHWIVVEEIGVLEWEKDSSTANGGDCDGSDPTGCSCIEPEDAPVFVGQGAVTTCTDD